MAQNEETETQWTGHDLYGLDGEKIGTIDDIRVGEFTGGLKWLVVKTGVLGTHKRYVPAGEVQSVAGKLSVSFTKDKVKDAPHVKDELASLPEVEEKLCNFYGLDYVRSATQPAEGCVETQDEGDAN